MKKIDLEKLQNSEHLSYDQEILKLLTEAALTPLETLRQKLSAGTAEEDAAQKVIKKSAFTKQLAEKDHYRDDFYRGLNLRVQSELYTPDTTIREAARRIDIVLQTYGNLVEENYQKESTDISGLLQDLQSDKYADDATKCGIMQWLGWLQDANVDFMELYGTRRDDQSAQPVFDLKAIRKSQDALLREIWKNVDALAILQPSEAVYILVSRMDATTEKWKLVLAQRKGTAVAKKNKQNGDSDTTPTDII